MENNVYLQILEVVQVNVTVFVSNVKPTIRIIAAVLNMYKLKMRR